MAEIQEYKGNKILCLNPGERFPFSFGLGKAKMILENLDVIKKFVETEGKDLGEFGKKQEEPAS
jgi:hypothetical protein